MKKSTKRATCYGSKNGLKITVEEAKCMQASAYLPIQLFEEFTLTEDIIFKINLNILVECLSIFLPSINAQGSAVTLEMHYKVKKTLAKMIKKITFNLKLKNFQL